MLSKSLIPFSFDGQGCVPSLLFDLGPYYFGGNEDNMASFERSHAHTGALSALNTAAGQNWPMPPLETPGRSQASLGLSFVGSLLLPGVHEVLFVLRGTGVVAAQHWSDPEEIPHVHGQRSPSKMVGGAKLFRIEPLTCQRCSEGSKKPCAPQDPETPQRLRQNCVWVSSVETVGDSVSYGPTVHPCRDRGSGCSRPGCDISPPGGGCQNLLFPFIDYLFNNIYFGAYIINHYFKFCGYSFQHKVSTCVCSVVSDSLWLHEL